MNIVNIILQLLGSGDTTSRIASTLGIGQAQAGQAVSATVPTILAGLTGVASRPGGGAEIANAVAQQDPGLLDNLSGLLSGVGGGGTVVPHSSAAQGSNILSSLLGGGNMGQISSVLSRFTGVGEGGIGKLLGLLAPVVLGVIGRHAGGANGAGITSLLAGQKDNIASAIPSGLRSQLSSAIPGLSGILGGTTHVSDPTYAPSTAPRPVKTGGSSALKWLIPVIVVVLALLFLPKMCRRDYDNTGVVNDTTRTTVNATSDSTRLINDASGLITDATNNIASINDQASASAALPRLRDITAKLGGLSSLQAGLPASLQKTVGDSLRPLIDRLRQAAQPVLSLPGVGAQLKPTVDAMLNQLDRLAPPA